MGRGASPGRWPTFVVIGAAKAGSTALYMQLKSHPEIYMSPNKEPRFFAFAGGAPRYAGPAKPEDQDRPVVSDPDEYRRLFAGAPARARALGECSPLYLYSERAARNLRRYVPEARLLAVLRHPVERAFSAYLNLVREGLETLDFMAALDAEEERVAAGWAPHWHYARRGRYFEQLAAYLDLFPRERLKIYLYDDYVQQPRRLLEDLFAFLGVERCFPVDVRTRYNVSGVPRAGWLERGKSRLRARLPVRLLDEPWLHRLGGAAARLLWRRRALPAPARARLREYYRDDVVRLQALVGRDLAHWLD